MKKIKEMKKLRSKTKSKNKRKPKLDTEALATLSEALNKMGKYRSCFKWDSSRYNTISQCAINRLKAIKENIEQDNCDENPELYRKTLQYARTALKTLSEDANPGNEEIIQALKKGITKEKVIQTLEEGITELKKFGATLPNPPQIEEEADMEVLAGMDNDPLSKALGKMLIYRTYCEWASSEYKAISQRTITRLRNIKKNIGCDKNSELCRKALKNAQTALKNLKNNPDPDQKKKIQPLKKGIKKEDAIQTLKEGIKELEKFSKTLKNPPKIKSINKFKIEKIDKFSRKVAEEKPESEQEEKSLLSSEQPCEFFSQNTDKKLLLNFDENPLIGNTPFDLRINQYGNAGILPAPLFLSGKKAEDAENLFPEEENTTQKKQMEFGQLSQSDKDADEISSFSLSNDFIDRKRQGSGVLFEEFYAGSRKHY